MCMVRITALPMQPRRVNHRKWHQQARLSTCFLDNTVVLLCTLIFGGAQIFYTVYDRWKEASMPKLARFMHFFNTIPACARRTERQTQGHSLYPSGSGHISVTDHSASCTGLVHLPSSSLCLQCPRAQSLARYCSFCTWRTS